VVLPVYASVYMNLREFLDCVHGVYELMEGRAVNKLYIAS